MSKTSDAPLAPFPEHVQIRPGVPLVTHLPKHSGVADQYRKLAFQIEERRPPSGRDGHVVAVGSQEVGVGKTLTSINLALTFARGWDRRVLLIEGDADRPTFSKYFEIDPKTEGLAQTLQKKQPIKQAMVAVRGTGLKVLTAGTNDGAGDLLSGPRLKRVLQEARKSFRIVVVDCPPLGISAGRSLAARADSVALVVRARVSRREAIEAALESLGPDKIAGFVFNDAFAKDDAYSYYGSYYSEDKVPD